MKKFLSICVIIICMIVIGMPITKADTTHMYKIELTVTHNKEQKDFEIYILLPEQYIRYAINQADLNSTYNGVQTLKENDIPGIAVDKMHIQDETYNENGIEYVQILLGPEEENIYTFEILSNYTYMDMKFRIKNDEKDYIMHIDNFEVRNNVCDITYNYEQDEIKQVNKIIVNVQSIVLMIILIFIIIIAIISKIKTQNKDKNE